MAFDFRLISGGLFDGATNMARDEVISRTVAAGDELPTLRLYGWDPPGLSLGQAQRFDAVDEAACRNAGVDIVRRPTGGRAILHTDELSYSLALPASHPIAAGDVVTSYRRIARAIVEALKRLGVPEAGTHAEANEEQAKSPVCFEVSSPYEVVGGGKKLVGSAQWRREDAVLQHGSLPLHGDIARVCLYLIGAPEPERVRARAGTLAEVAGRAISWEEAALTWRGAFADTLDISFRVGRLSAAEERAAAELRASRYGNDAWTRRR